MYVNSWKMRSIVTIALWFSESYAAFTGITNRSITGSAAPLNSFMTAKNYRAQQGGNPETKLGEKDFKGGTYRITKPGKYTLNEDITFEPSGPEVTDVLFPKRDSKPYPQFGGYFLGFFAAMTVEADNVIIDCQGHEIKMSEKFHKHQRFFAIIELGSKPFISGQGPPQFSSQITSPGPPISANNVVIENCRLGLSSHHGIHGNNNNGVTVRNITIKDFEVGGISLNGATKVKIEKADIGPSLANTFSASLSQAIFLDHLTNTLIPWHKKLAEYTATTEVTLAGETKKVKEVFTELRTQFRAYLEGGGLASPRFQNVFGFGDQLPDGSAMYGIMLHMVGAAAGDFGAGCGIGENPDDKMVGDPTILKDIHIHDLKLNADQITRAVIGDGPQLMGPAGDVFPVTDLWNTETFEYEGNPLSDAQVALAALAWPILGSDLRTVDKTESITWAEAKYYFGALHIPFYVRDWVAGETKGTTFRDSLIEEEAFKCDGDAMTHHNKGIVGMRLEFQRNVEISNVKVDGITNVGEERAAPFCHEPNYKGNDVRGVVFVYCKNVKKENLSVGWMRSPYGKVLPGVLVQMPRPVSALVSEKKRREQCGLTPADPPLQHTVGRRLRAVTAVK